MVLLRDRREEVVLCNVQSRVQPPRPSIIVAQAASASASLGDLKTISKEIFCEKMIKDDGRTPSETSSFSLGPKIPSD